MIWNARGLAWLAAAAIACLVALAATAQVANAAFGIASFDGELLTADGAAASQAGGHPALGWTGFDLNQGEPDMSLGFPIEMPAGTLRQATVELPPGLIGNPSVVARCTNAQLLTSNCPADSQVGQAVIAQAGGPPTRDPIYNMVPPPGVPASFAFFPLQVVVVRMDAKLRTGDDYGLTIDVREVSQGIVILGSKITFWGVPSDPVHDPDRQGKTATYPQRPFMTNPTSCPPGGTGLKTRISLRSWEGEADSGSFVSHDVAPNQADPLGPTGCEKVPFNPSIDFDATSRQADAPTGLDIALNFPREGLERADGIAGGHLKRAEVTLPVGMSINPAAASGLEACSDAALGLANAEPVRCPNSSKIGTARALSPLLAKYDARTNEVLTDEDGAMLDEVAGSIYVREQVSDDPQSGEMFRLALVLENEDRGILVKLGGRVSADPATGQLRAVFDDNPQLPVDSIELSFKGGPRAPLATPPTCGEHEIVSRLTSWARPEPVVQTDSLTVDCPGAAGFAPGFDAGTDNPVGAAFSPFVARINRDDRQQALSGVRVDLPKGLIAKLKGVPLCPEAVAGDGTGGTCPAESRIGTATVTAGVGATPFGLRGDAYLTGPYNGGPYGLAVHVPAVAGPFDLGMVKVRNALRVDPETAQVSVASDPLPQIVKGVPVRLRSVGVDVDRPAFTINPTSCREQKVDAALTAIDGAVHETGSRFQVGDCASLAFRPKIAMRLIGRKQTTTGRNPGLRTVVTQASSESNIGRVKVTMPSSVALDPDNTAGSTRVCDYDASLRADCPANTIIGKATAVTPVLDGKLTGPVHLVQGIKFGSSGNRIRTTPSLLVKLRGEVAINLRGRTSTQRGSNRLVTTFAAVPDAPVSRFTLSVAGGKRGILVVTATRRGKIDICRKRQVAAVDTHGHNGRRAVFATVMKTPCGGEAAKAKRR